METKGDGCKENKMNSSCISLYKMLGFAYGDHRFLEPRDELFLFPTETLVARFARKNEVQKILQEEQTTMISKNTNRIICTYYMQRAYRTLLHINYIYIIYNIG